MTGQVPGLNKLLGEEWVEIHPLDAESLDINDKETIIIRSRRGEVKARAKITEESPVGMIYMNFHFAESPTNAVTNTVCDPISKTPELKYCAVRVEKIMR
jgi:predicted molibdopterin-dependent oxidoreductase YjgC